MACERQRLHRQDRQHARHDVEDQPAQQREQQRERQTQFFVAVETHGRNIAAYGLHLQRLHGFVGRSEHQHAVKFPKPGELLSRLHAKHQPVFRKAHGLGSGIRHRTRLSREELRIDRPPRSRQRGRLDVEIARCRVAHRPGRDDGKFGARGCELFRRNHIGRRRIGFDEQKQGQRRVFGNADLAADQPLHGSREPHLLAGLRVLRHMQVDQQPDLAFKAIVHQRADRIALGIGPLDGVGAPTRRQRPGDLGRRAGIARIQPIGVPAGTDILFQCHGHRAAGGDRDAVRHQAGMHLGRPIDLGRRRHERCRQDKE